MFWLLMLVTKNTIEDQTLAALDQDFLNLKKKKFNSKNRNQVMVVRNKCKVVWWSLTQETMILKSLMTTCRLCSVLIKSLNLSLI